MIDYKAEAERILEDEHVESSVDAIIALCRRIAAEALEDAARTCDYYSEEDGDVASQAAVAIRTRKEEGRFVRIEQR